MREQNIPYTVRILLAMIAFMLLVSLGCATLPQTISSEEYARVWNESRQKDDEIHSLENQVANWEYKYSNLSRKYNLLVEEKTRLVTSLIPSIGKTGVVQGKLRYVDIKVGDSNSPLIRDRIYLGFESGLSVYGYGNFNDYSCIKIDQIYQVCYQEIERPDRLGKGEVVLQITAIKSCN